MIIKFMYFPLHKWGKLWSWGKISSLNFRWFSSCHEGNYDTSLNIGKDMLDYIIILRGSHKTNLFAFLANISDIGTSATVPSLLSCHNLVWWVPCTILFRRRGELGSRFQYYSSIYCLCSVKRNYCNHLSPFSLPVCGY